jgi:hypothetical protein
LRKRIIAPIHHEATSADSEWLDLERLAEVEITSEDPAHPIEFALLAGKGSGWRATGPGKQTVRLIFANPQRITRIWLRFEDRDTERTQEYALRWSPDGGHTWRDIVRQQWNFSPLGANFEVEHHHVELSAVTVLELSIVPDTSGSAAIASLEQLRVA